jgi:hypothetical protein
LDQAEVKQNGIHPGFPETLDLSCSIFGAGDGPQNQRVVKGHNQRLSARPDDSAQADFLSAITHCVSLSP